MTNVLTETLSISVTKRTADMLRAFAGARNGSLHNAADEIIRKGITSEMRKAPYDFRMRYGSAYPEQDND